MISVDDYRNQGAIARFQPALPLRVYLAKNTALRRLPKCSIRMGSELLDTEVCVIVAALSSTSSRRKPLKHHYRRRHPAGPSLTSKLLKGLEENAASFDIPKLMSSAPDPNNRLPSSHRRDSRTSERGVVSIMIGAPNAARPRCSQK